MARLTRAISFATAAVLVFSMASGCSNKKTSGKTSSAAGAGTSVSESSDISSTGSELSSLASQLSSSNTGGDSQNGTTTGINMGGTSGQTSSVRQSAQGSTQDMYDKIKGTTVTVASWSQPDAATTATIQAFEKRYGCKVNYKIYGWSEWQSKIYQMVSAGNPPDTLIINDAFFLPYIAKNVVQPLDSYFNIKDGIWNQSVCNLFTWNGKHYGVALQDEDYIFYIYYNQDMFDDYGVKTPMEYYKAGNWNFDTFETVAKQFAKDTNKDGIPDQRGYATWYWDLFVLANGGSEISINQNKSISLTLTNSNELKGLDVMQKLKNDLKTFDQSQDNWDQDFMAGKVAMIAERPWQAVGENSLYSKCKFTIGVAPFPTGPNASKNSAPGMVYAWGVPIGAKNPLGGIAWYYYSSLWQRQHANDASIVANRNRSYKDTATYNWIKSYNSTHTVNATMIYGLPNWWDNRWQLWQDVLDNDVPVATAVEKHKSMIQSEINTILSGLKS